MKNLTVCEKDIKAYLEPEFENLQALLKHLNCPHSLKTLSLLKLLLDTELYQHFHHHKMKKKTGLPSL